MKYKKIVLTIALSAGLCSGTSALASGIPTVDAAAIAQMVQQLTQMQQMYSNMVQRTTRQSTPAKLTGTRGLTGGLQPESEKSDTNLRPQSSQRNNERHVVTQQFGPRYF
ncbi:MAG: type IV secretion system protein [Parasutterella excrementihominis]|uniref:type IV secretion system protein n=1 Tax=Parasutterella excrementihominis TaxID=487175 RepID=UPI0039934D94